MTRNDIFNLLLHLTGLTYRNEDLIILFAEQGLNVNKAKIKRWRKRLDSPLATAIPDIILRAFFYILFEKKKKDTHFFSYSLEAIHSLEEIQNEERRIKTMGKYVSKNQIFNHLIFLTGFEKNKDVLIRLFSEKGLNVNSTQIKCWRRTQEEPIPDAVLDAFFDILFDTKSENRTLFSYYLPNPKSE